MEYCKKKKKLLHIEEVIIIRDNISKKNYISWNMLNIMNH